MKPFGSIDITENKKNERINGAEFIVESTSSGQAKALENETENAEELLKKSKLPLPLRIVEWVCGILAAVVVADLLRATTDEDAVTLTEAYNNAAWIFWMGGISLLVWAVLALIERNHAKKVLESDENSQVSSQLDRLTDNIYEELGVPEGAVDVDLLTFRYKRKKDKTVPKEQGLSMTAYFNPEMKAYVEDDRLCLVDLEHKYAFERSELTAIRTVKKSIALPSWNKDVHPTEGHFKQYKMTVDQYAQTHLKPYHILELRHNGEEWGIYFPCYELPTFEALTGLKAE